MTKKLVEEETQHWIKTERDGKASGKKQWTEFQSLVYRVLTRSLDNVEKTTTMTMTPKTTTSREV